MLLDLFLIDRSLVRIKLILLCYLPLHLASLNEILLYLCLEVSFYRKHILFLVLIEG